MSLRERIVGLTRRRSAPQPADLQRLSERVGHLEALWKGSRIRFIVIPFAMRSGSLSSSG